MRKLIDLLWNEWKTVEDQIEGFCLELERISAADLGCTRIRQIPGIGPIVATAIVAAIGNGAAFRKGRDFAAWLGVVPRQYSTGSKARLLGISKRVSGNLLDELVDNNRPTNKDRYARNSSGQERCAPPKAEYICEDLSSRPQLFPCSRAADHAYSSM